MGPPIARRAPARRVRRRGRCASGARSPGPATRRAPDSCRLRRTGGTRAVIVLRERGELNEFTTDDQAGPADRAVPKADLAAHADAVALRDARAEHVVEEGLDLVLVTGAGA